MGEVSNAKLDFDDFFAAMEKLEEAHNSDIENEYRKLTIVSLVLDELRRMYESIEQYCASIGHNLIDIERKKILGVPENEDKN